MKHFIITRFNLKLEQWKTSKDGSKVLTEEWLKQRFELFETYCLPSVVNQTSGNFQWLIFFDIDTPIKYKERIEKLVKPFSHFQIIYTDGFASLNTTLSKELDNRLDLSDRYLITTRLDNDDAIHKDFTSTVQSSAYEHNKLVIDMRKGFQIKITEDNFKVKEFNFPLNQFLSVVENAHDYETILSKPHLEWGKSNQIVVQNEEYYWVEIIHERNKENELKRYLPFSNKLNWKDFGINYNGTYENKLLIKLRNIFQVYPFIIIRAIYKALKAFI